ncbi:hypothetical protein L6164_014489 [Bauhinia variegata]|uniref:Uncharacterized protein n=1 Tax=Bauhinia variegata TaxID=167791 RepID=A0ACB9NIV7_BAUVA|nr:hypothetical protein L6164_014489 [Bauhinia variegata]
MYNQVNHGPHFGQGPHTPMPPAVQQYPQAPTPHIQQGHPAAPVQHMPAAQPHSGLPAPHVYLHGPPATSSTVPQNSSVQVPPGVGQKNAQSYVIPPPLLHGNIMMPHTFSSTGQNSQHSLNSGVQNHHIPLPGPPPAIGHTHQEASWVPAPPPPPPPSSSSQGQSLYRPPFLPCPPLHGDGQSLLHGPPPLLPLTSTSGVLAPTPHGYSAAGSCELGSITALPLVSPSPPSLATSDLPPPPSQPTETNTVQRIKTLCQLIAENGPHFEDKTRQVESGNPDYAFLFGGDPGSEAAISHEYFLWMKKKCILEHRWHDRKSESQLRPLAVDSSRPQGALNFAREHNLASDSDMEMEDDITLSDKDQGLNNTLEGLNQQHYRVDKEFSTNEQIHQLQNSTENDPIKDISSREVSGLGSLEMSKQNEGLSDSEHIKYGRPVAKVHSPVNDSTEVAEFPHGAVSEKSAAPLAETMNLAEHGVCNPDRDSGQPIRSGSPIRLLQGYASDDTSDNEDGTCFSDVNVSTDIGSRNPFRAQKELGLLSKVSPNLVEEVKGTHTRSVSSETADGCLQHNLENHVSVNFSVSVEALQGKDGLSRAGTESGGKGYSVQQEDGKETSKFESTPFKVDEFGRFVREGAADSDSDDSHYRRTRKKNRRRRSSSRSRSPLDRRSRRRRRRSPWRRKDRRSRSRSWSPRKRRSRSRSPILRRSGEFYGDNMKRDRGECHNFLQGRCNRGSSCRYMHHEYGTISSSRHHRNKHDLEVSSSKNSRNHEGVKNISVELSGHERNRVRSQDVQLCQNVSGSSNSQEIKQRKEGSGRNDVASTTSHHDGQLVDTIPNKFEIESSREVAHKMQEIIEEPNTVIHGIESFHKAVDSNQQLLADGFPSQALSSGDALKLPAGAPQNVIPSEKGSSSQQFQSNVSFGALVQSDHPSQRINEPFVSESLLDNRSMTSGSMVSSIEPFPYMLPSTRPQSATSSVGQWLSSEHLPLNSQTSKELSSYGASARDLPPNSYQLPPPPPPPLSHSQGENTKHMPQMSRDYGMVQQNAFFPYQSTTRESFQAYPALLHAQNSHFSAQTSSSWPILPPPPSQAVYGSNYSAPLATSHVSSEFNQSQLHSRTDLVSQTLARPGLPSHSQGPEYQDQAHPSILEQSRSLMLTKAMTSKPLSQENPTNHSFAGPNLGREDHFKQLAVQDSQFSSSSSFGGLHNQPKHFSWEPDANRLHPSSGDRLPQEHIKTSSHVHLSSQKQQPVHGLQCSASDGNLDVPGDTFNVSRYPPDVMDSIHSASLPDFGGSRISAHYNPYASTFERPLSSKFGTNIFCKDNDIIHGNNYGSSSSLNHTRTDGQDLSGVGLRQTASLPKSARTIEQTLPRSGGDQYDPLFDSIEPSSTSLKKFDLNLKQEATGESNISIRPKSSYKSFDAEENKHGEIGAVASTTSQNNDEYGETADAEVGVVENESPSNPMDDAKTNSGDIEIDQIKSPGKRKKNKDSRSMKLFKVSIANFVKEVLKPSWRQGNMSKVAFKTIVKKTVDKVSGAMKGHHVPKSQAKINQYIDSSQRKLTKLVMGYVDKYVKELSSASSRFTRCCCDVAVVHQHSTRQNFVTQPQTCHHGGPEVIFGFTLKGWLPLRMFNRSAADYSCKVTVEAKPDNFDTTYSTMINSPFSVVHANAMFFSS